MSKSRLHTFANWHYSLLLQRWSLHKNLRPRDLFRNHICKRIYLGNKCVSLLSKFGRRNRFREQKILGIRLFNNIHKSVKQKFTSVLEICPLTKSNPSLLRKLQEIPLITGASSEKVKHLKSLSGLDRLESLDFLEI